VKIINPYPGAKPLRVAEMRQIGVPITRGSLGRLIKEKGHLLKLCETVHLGGIKSFHQGTYAKILK
jgi:hypothetical protein